MLTMGSWSKKCFLHLLQLTKIKIQLEIKIMQSHTTKCISLLARKNNSVHERGTSVICSSRNANSYTKYFFNKFSLPNADVMRSLSSSCKQGTLSIRSTLIAITCVSVFLMFSVFLLPSSLASGAAYILCRFNQTYE